MLIKKFLYIISVLLILLAKAELRVEYQVTPLKDNPFLEEFDVLPYKVIMTIGDKYVKIEKKTHISFGDEFQIYPIGENYYNLCVSGLGLSSYFKKNRIVYDTLIHTDEYFRVLGSKCRKIIGKKGNSQIEIYSTDQYGINFHPNANIKGIALLYIVEDVRFEKVVYEATSIKVVDVSNDFFDISDFEKGRVRKYKKPFLEGKNLKKVKVRTLSGERAELNFSNGKINVINFWFKGCKPCVREIPLLNKVVDSLQSESINFIAISTDDPYIAKEFVKNNTFNYQHYAWGKDAANKYAIESYPTHIITDKKGIAKYIYNGFSSQSIYYLARQINELLSEDD